MYIFYLLVILFFLKSMQYYYKKTRLLFFVESYGVNQLNLLYMQIKSFIIICESGYIIKLIIHHTDILNNSSFQHFYCFNRNYFVDVIFIRISSNITHLLVKEHRKYITNNLNEIKKYHHVGFFENDIGFSLANLRYYFYTLALI